MISQSLAVNLSFTPAIIAIGIEIATVESIEKKIASLTRVAIAIAMIVSLAETRTSLRALQINIFFL